MIPGCKWWFGDSALDLVCLLQLFFEGFRPGDLGGCWLFSDLPYGFLLSWMFGQVSYGLPCDFLRFYELLVLVCWFSWVVALRMPAILFASWCFWLIFHLGASVSWLPWNLCLTVKYPHNMPIGSWSHVSCCRFCALAFCFIYTLWFLCLWSVCFRGFPELIFIAVNIWARTYGSKL